MNIILFGPPGIGKSTIIGILKTLGLSAIDLEDVYPNAIRFQLPNMLKDNDVIFGGADLNPSRRYPAVKVLLIAPQRLYDRRRALRDAQQPGKAKQDHQDVSTWLSGTHFDHVIQATGSPESTASQIVKLYRRYKSCRC